MEAKPPGQLLVHRLIAAVGLHVDHPDDLAAPTHELSEVASLRFRQRPSRRSDAFGEEGAITSASSVSGFASRPIARAKSRIWRGLTCRLQVDDSSERSVPQPPKQKRSGWADFIG